MNIDQFRELKSQGEVDSTPVEQPQVPATPPVEPQTTPPETTPEIPTQPEGQTAEPTQPQTITLDGKAITPEELREWQSGYMRSIDYTQKTQEIAQQREELEQAIALMQTIQNNPELAQTVQQQAQIDLPSQEAQQIHELQEQLQFMQFEREVEQLSSKYQDFDVDKAIEIMEQRDVGSLEDAYLLGKSMNPTPPQQIDEAALRAQIMAELKAELELEKGTQSIISTNTSNVPPVQDNVPQLTPQQMKVAQAMKLSPQEYVKWMGDI